MTNLFVRPVAQVLSIHDDQWGRVGALEPGQTGTTPSGASVRVDAAWQSALGDPCKRLIFTSPAMGSQLICQGRDGWYALRDISAEEDTYVN